MNQFQAANAVREGLDSVPVDPRTLDETTGPRMPELRHYLRMVIRWRWWILATIGVALIVGLVVTMTTTRQYTAVTTLEIQREGDRVVKLESVERETTAADQEFYQTQYGLLRARSLAERVARNLRLGEDAEFIAAFRLQPKAGVISTPEGRQRVATDILLGNIAVDPVRASRLVAVRFTSPNPVLSARIANAWAQNFIESNLDRRFQSTAYARKFLEERLGGLKAKLEDSERALVTYAGAQRIINLPATTVTGGGGSQTTSEHSIVADDLTALNTELGQATADRIRAESRLSGSGASSPEAIASPTIASLRQKRAEAASDYARLLVQFEPGYPQAQALLQQIKQLDAAIGREESRVGSSLAGTYREASSREAQLKSRVEGLKSGLLDLRRRSIQYNIYQREVDTNRELYDGLLQRYKEIGIAGGVGNNNVSIVDPAQIPDGPSKPNLVTNMLLALLIGSAAGIALALAREQIDEAITDPEDLKRLVGLPLIGVIPNVREGSPQDAMGDRKSALSEAYLSAQTNLDFTTAHGAPRSLAVTSTRPAEGKSSTAYALAQTMARGRRKVVLIDCDMRSPSVHQMTGATNAFGVSNFLSGGDQLDTLVQWLEADRLAVMTAGPQPPNAAELLTGDRLKILIDQLLLRFDQVIVDAPPVMGIADAPLIASKVEAVVYVVESHAIRSSLVRVALDRLRAAQAHIVGALLVKFDSKRAHLGYGYDYGYGYGDDHQ